MVPDSTVHWFSEGVLNLEGHEPRFLGDIEDFLFVVGGFVTGIVRVLDVHGVLPVGQRVRQ